MHTHIKPALAHIALTTLASLSLTAENDLARNESDLPLYQLDDYIVVAHTYAVPYTEIGSTVEIISREELEIGQSLFLLDAIRELPGISVRNNGGPGSSFGITTRGLNSNRPTVLIDGIEVSNPADGRMINPGNMFSSSIERVEILKGPQSSLYGADALAGVISIQTRRANDNQNSGSLSTGIGTFNTREVSADYQFQKDALKFTANLSRFTSDGFSSQTGNTEEDGYTNTHLSAKIDYQISETLRAYALGYWIDANSEYDVSTSNPVGTTYDKRLFAKTGTILQATEQWETQIGFAYTNVQSGGISNFGPYGSQGDRYKVDWRNVINKNERWSLAAGIEYELEDNREAPGQRDNTSLYVDNTIELLSNLHWTLGGRYDNNSDYGISRTWRSTISYAIEPLNTRLHGSYGTSFQAPTFFQTTSPLYGNPNLAPEEGRGWDFGVETSLAGGALVIDVTTFGYDIQDKISFLTLTSSPAPFTGTYVNDESYKSRGLESSLTWFINERIKLGANYTYSDAEYGDSIRAERVPEHLANISATWSALQNTLQLKTTLLYVGKQKGLRTSTTDQEAYATINFAGQYAVNETLTVWAALNNILDKNYEEIEGFNSPGFNIRTGIRLNF